MLTHKRSEPKLALRGVAAKVASWLNPVRVVVYPTAITIITLVAWGTNWFVRPSIDGTPRQAIIGGDFMAAYTGGRLLLEGRQHDLYDAGAQLALMRGIVSDSDTTALPPFVYPPYNAAAYALFSLGGNYWQALAGWLVAGFLALVASVMLFRKTVFLAPAPPAVRLVALCFLFSPTVDWLLYGQSTAFSLLLYTATYVMLRRGRDFSAGFLLGLLLFKPQLAMGLVLVLLIQRRWRALLGAGVGSVVWLTIGFALSPQAMFEYVRFSANLFELQKPGMWGEHSLFFFFFLLLNEAWPAAAGIAGLLATAGGGLLAVRMWWVQNWQPADRQWDLRMAASIALGVLISPHLYKYDLMLLLLPLAIVWSHYRPNKREQVLDGGGVLVATALLYLGTWLSSYLTLAQLKLTSAVGLPALGLQISVPLLLGWVATVYRQTQAAVPAQIAGQTKAVELVPMPGRTP